MKKTKRRSRAPLRPSETEQCRPGELSEGIPGYGNQGRQSEVDTSPHSKKIDFSTIFQRISGCSKRNSLVADLSHEGKLPEAGEYRE